ncbi:MAG TPA: ABC transporter permease [Actinomycetota bacterium]|nr:ABC transporter permease [Actinomycetota bacterium]
MGGRRYVIKKVLQALATLAFILVFNFFLFRVMPSDPVKLLTKQKGIQLSQAAQQELINELGLDKPLPAQFLTYAGDTLRGQFGPSFLYQGQSVMDVFLRALWPTLLLVGTATVLMTIIGLYLGIRGGWSRGSRLDTGSMGFSLLFYSMPDFWLAMMLLVLFSTFLGWFPSGGYSTPNADITGIPHVVDVLNHLFLPMVTLTLGYLGEYYLVMRSSLLDVLGEEYVTTVRAKGIREDRVLWGHAVRNALLPTISQIALGFGFILGGAITIELVFSYPGLGLLTINALDSQDFRLLQGLFFFASVAILISNLAADLLYSWFDPRVKEA